jgi:hypothetical protein
MLDPQPREPAADSRRWWPAYRYPSDCPNAPAYWLLFALSEPREFAYVAPRRIACRLLRRHNVTCRGRADHPRTVTVQLDNSTGTFTPRRR